MTNILTTGAVARNGRSKLKTHAGKRTVFTAVHERGTNLDVLRIRALSNFGLTNSAIRTWRSFYNTLFTRNRHGKSPLYEICMCACLHMALHFPKCRQVSQPATVRNTYRTSGLLRKGRKNNQVCFSVLHISICAQRKFTYNQAGQIVTIVTSYTELNRAGRSPKQQPPEKWWPLLTPHPICDSFNSRACYHLNQGLRGHNSCLGLDLQAIFL